MYFLSLFSFFSVSSASLLFSFYFLSGFFSSSLLFRLLFLLLLRFLPLSFLFLYSCSFGISILCSFPSFLIFLLSFLLSSLLLLLLLLFQLLLLCSPPPLLSSLFPLLLWLIFSSFSLSPSLSSLGFLPPSAFLLLFLFSCFPILLFLLFVFPFFLCSSSFVVFCLVDFFFLRVFLLCRQFLPSLLLSFSYLFLHLTFLPPSVPFLLRFFFLSFRFFLFLYFVMYSFVYRSLVAFLRSVVSFSFLFLLPFRLSSSTVSFLFCPPYCIPPRLFFLPCAVHFLLVFPQLAPPPPPLLCSLLVPSLFFALPPVLAVPCWSPFFLLLRSFPAFVCAFFPYKSLAHAMFLSLSLQRWYPCYRVACLIGFAIVCRLLSSAPASFSLSWRGGDSDLSSSSFQSVCCFLSLYFAGFLFLIHSYCFFRLFLRCLVLSLLRRMVL